MVGVPNILVMVCIVSHQWWARLVYLHTTVVTVCLHTTVVTVCYNLYQMVGCTIYWISNLKMALERKE